MHGGLEVEGRLVLPLLLHLLGVVWGVVVKVVVVVVLLLVQVVVLVVLQVVVVCKVKSDFKHLKFKTVWKNLNPNTPQPPMTVTIIKTTQQIMMMMMIPSPSQLECCISSTVTLLPLASSI